MVKVCTKHPGKTAASKRIPAPKKTANSTKTGDERSLFTCLVSVVDDLVLDQSHVLPVFNLLSERKAATAARGGIIDVEVFDDDVATISGLPDEFKMSVLTENSDLSAQSFLAALGKDPQVLNKFLTLGLQLPKQTRVNQYIKPVAVMKKFMKARILECGNRLSDLKAKGGISASGDVDFLKVGCFTPTYTSAGVLDKLFHSASTRTVDVIKKTGINTEWSLVDNFDDLFAGFKFSDDIPVVPVHGWFKNDVEGIDYFGYKNFKGKPKELESHCKTVYEEHRREVKATQSAPVSSATTTALTAFRKEKANSIFEKARHASKDKTPTENKLRTISLRHLKRDKSLG